MQWLLSISMPVRVVLSVLMLGGLLCGAAVIWSQVHWRRWSRSYRHACELLTTGGLPQAEEYFRRAAQGAVGVFRTAALAGMGVCRMQRGAYAEAAAMLEPLMERRLPSSMRLEEIALPGHLALCLAMLGDTPRARHWLGEAHERFGGRVTFLVLPEVAILCREGHLGAALKMMEDCWPLLMTDGRVCSRLRLFRAFAQWKVDPERNTDFVFMTLLSLAPVPEWEMAFCRDHWPVLADFMQKGNDLVARQEAQRAQREAELQARYDERDRQLAARVVAARATPKPDDGEDTSD
jgi:tetratricopeptide (TPR) repeat protein